MQVSWKVIRGTGAYYRKLAMMPSFPTLLISWDIFKIDILLCFTLNSFQVFEDGRHHYALIHILSNK